MRSPRFFVSIVASLMVVGLVGAFGPAPQSAAPPTVNAADASEPVDQLMPDRADVADRANRSSSERDLLAMAATSTTTEAPTTTTTAAPTTTTAARKTTTTTEAEEPTEVASNSAGATAAAVARKQVGKAYKLGASGPSAFDCSGLIIYAYGQAGVDMPRLTSEGFPSKYTRISRSQLQPGDVIYRPGHVGLYVGDGQMVHASTPRGGVKLAPIDATGTPKAFVRIS